MSKTASVVDAAAVSAQEGNERCSASASAKLGSSSTEETCRCWLSAMAVLRYTTQRVSGLRALISSHCFASPAALSIGA